MSASDLSGVVEAGDAASQMPASAPAAPAPTVAAAEPLSQPAEPGAPPPALDPAVAALCRPVSEADPCGPDLEDDGAYLNALAGAEGVLPNSFFDVLDGGKPFDRSSVDLPGHIEALQPLLLRTRDLRLLVMRARLLGLNRDLGGFAVTVAAIGEWLDKYWDGVHPRVAGGDLEPRVAALAALDLPTVIFPLQYAPLFETRRIGAVSYRALMVAAGDVKARPGEQKHSAADLTQAVADADPEKLAPMRQHVAMLKAALVRIRQAFALQGGSSGLETLPPLVDKISAFLDPQAALDPQSSDAQAGDADAAKDDGTTSRSAGAAPTSLARAKQALAAVADYYSRLEPSSPTLPLVRQAHDLIGKSFFEVMSILMPTQIDNAAFQIGAEQIFELPVGRLPNEAGEPSTMDYPSQNAGAGEGENGAQPADAEAPPYSVRSRSEAIALLDQVHRFFRGAEPSSPVPMLCERARALAERDFMGVLRDVLPKNAFKNPGADR